MDNQNGHTPPINTPLKIDFPTSSEDHRLQLVQINGSVFAILHSPLESMGPINLLCEDWSLVLLAPIRSEKKVEIKAINIIALNEVRSQTDEITIEATNRLLQLSVPPSPAENVIIEGKGGQYQYDDDPSTFIKYFQLFTAIITHARANTPEGFSEAQQKTLLALCALAEKMEGGIMTLTIQRVLKMWNIDINGENK